MCAYIGMSIMNKDQQIVSNFNDLAAYYDDYMNMAEWCGHTVLMQNLAPYIKSEYKALDIGIGTGSLAALLNQHISTEVSGIDVSTKMIEECRRKGFTGDLRVENIQVGTSFLPESFDIIAGSGVIEYVDSLSLAAQEIKRLLKPNGIVAFTYEPHSKYTHGAMPTNHYSAADLQTAFSDLTVIDHNQSPFSAYKYVGNGMNNKRDVTNAVFIARL